MKNAVPFTAQDQAIILENRIKEILGNDAELYLFYKSNDYDVQGMSISHGNYYKIDVKTAQELVKDLDNIHVNLANSCPSETLFTIATKEDMQKWYNTYHNGTACKVVCDEYYVGGTIGFKGTNIERESYKQQWIKDNPCWIA